MSSNNTDRRLDFLFHLHNHINDQIRFSDTKAQILLAVSGAILSLLLSSVGDRPFHQGIFSLSFYLLCICFLLFSILAFLFSLYPRLKPKKTGELVFWDKIREKKVDDYVGLIQNANLNKILTEISVEVYNISHIAKTKYRILKLGVIALYIALILSVIIWLSSIGMEIHDP